MASSSSPKAKLDTSERHQRLTPSEIESLRQEMQQAGQWMKAELAKRRQQKAKA